MWFSDSGLWYHVDHQIARRFDANLDGVVNSSDPWHHSVFNERWQEIAVFIGSETTPRERFVMHAAGVGGYGGSSYIDHVVLRDRDYRGGEADPENDPPLPDGILEERRYILQNWRRDVIGVVDTHGSLIERRRYDAYGRPISVSPADVGAQGGVEGTDGLLNNNDAASYNTLYFGGQVKWSTDLGDGKVRRPNGLVESSDYARFNDYFNEGYTGGLGLVSDAAVNLRRGYAGYQYDDVLAGSGIISDKIVSRYHVRHRVLSSDDGKWKRRDPLGFVDGMGLYEYVKSEPITRVDYSGLRGCLIQNAQACLLAEIGGILPSGPPCQVIRWLMIHAPQCLADPCALAVLVGVEVEQVRRCLKAVAGGAAVVTVAVITVVAVVEAAERLPRNDCCSQSLCRSPAVGALSAGALPRSACAMLPYASPEWRGFFCYCGS